jgi:hypothetical protein
MSVSTKFEFDTPSDYIFDNTKISISGGKAQLKLQEADLPFTEDFVSDVGFTYDNTKAEFTGGMVRQKDQRPTNSTCGATYTTNINLNWGNGTLTGTSYGGADVSGGKLNLTSQTKYVTYSAVGNWSSSDTGCIRCKYTPNYSGNPSVISVLWSRLNLASSSNGLLQLYHDTSGRIRFMAINSSGLSIVDKSTNILSLISGTSYEIELDYDFVTGQTNLFIDGVSSFTTATGTGTTGTPTLIYIGTNFDKSVKSNSYIDDLEIFSTVQHTANYTKGYSLPATIYIETSVILPEMEHTGDGSILAFNSFDTTEVNTPRYTIQIGRSGNYLYWNGLEWVTSNGTYSQANDESTFNTNCEELPVSGEKYGQFKIIFTGSNSLSSVSELTANMNVNNGYLTTDPYLKIITKIRTNDLLEVLSSITKVGSDEIKIILTKNDIPYFWNGTSWIIGSLDYAHSNTVTDVNTNCITFVENGTDIYIYVFFHSATGSTTPDIDYLTLNYTYNAEILTLVNSTVWSYLRSLNLPLAEKIIKCTPSWTIDDGLIIVGTQVTTTTHEDGYWELEINTETLLPTYLDWIIENKKYRTNFITGINAFSELTLIEV